MKPVITLDSVCVSYRRKRMFRFRGQPEAVLKSVSLNVYQGECLGILGRNGAGKSTLLRVLAGILQPDQGSVTFNGRASLLTLQAGFAESLTGAENIVLGGMILGARRRQIMALFDDIVSFAELGAKIHEPLYSYSSGMRARLGFSVAYHIDPEVILLDEVLGVGDAGFRAKSAEAMQEKIHKGKTIVLVSHNPNIIRQNCNRAILIDAGQVVAEGEPDDVLGQL
ncbi:ABC transporter ATP-binding protein [Granulosicoccaceae sp. 1_MG-2023]|nr:ABC transporter ATP-binding protein [Granulosicoccaceae sp. 1_MG-2023]